VGGSRSRVSVEYDCACKLLQLCCSRCSRPPSRVAVRPLVAGELSCTTYSVVGPSNEDLGRVTMPNEFNVFTLRTAFIPTALSR
jgi:hypothetical protein